MRYKKVSKRVVEESLPSRTTCDLCGGKIGPSHVYDGNEITIEAKLGEIYPESDNRKIYEIDVCAACFVGRVRPAIEALGATFRERRADEDDRTEE